MPNIHQEVWTSEKTFTPMPRAHHVEATMRAFWSESVPAGRWCVLAAGGRRVRQGAGGHLRRNYTTLKHMVRGDITVHTTQAGEDGWIGSITRAPFGHARSLHPPRPSTTLYSRAHQWAMIVWEPVISPARQAGDSVDSSSSSAHHSLSGQLMLVVSRGRPLS